MPNQFHGPGLVGPDPLWMTFVSSGMALVFWTAMLGLVLWAAYRWARASVDAQRPQPVSVPREPSALELLRMRYVVGEIDAVTFESMLERLLASAADYGAAHELLAPRTLDGYDA